MKKKIVELWKWYFLGIAELPVMWGGIAGLLIFIVWLLYDGKFLSYPPPPTLSPISTVLAVWLGATIFSILLHLYVVRKKITVFSPRAFQTVIIYTAPDEPVIYNEALWGKFDYKIIKFPKDFGRVILKDHRYEQIVHLELEVKARKVILPFRFRMVWRQTPDAWDFHELITWQGKEAVNQKVFQLDECLQNVFVKYNLEEDRQKFEAAAEELVAQKTLLERQTALQTFNSIVGFPQHLMPAIIVISLISQDVKMIMFGREYSVNLAGV